MPTFHRSLSTRTEPGRRGARRTTARVDDFFHGFEVILEERGGVVTNSAATAHRHPWTTCPGALASVGRIHGPIEDAAPAVTSLPRADTCVHVNDLVWLASQQHEERHYEMEVSTFAASLDRDGVPLLRWQIHDWVITGSGPFAGLGLAAAGWSGRLDAVGAAAHADLREAVRVLRRAMLVAVGYYTLDWKHIERGPDVPLETMLGSCHTFSPGPVDHAVSLASVPDRRAVAR